MSPFAPRKPPVFRGAKGNALFSCRVAHASGSTSVRKRNIPGLGNCLARARKRFRGKTVAGFVSVCEFLFVSCHEEEDGLQNNPKLLLTIGHSTRTLEAFIHLLQAHEVMLVVDVRTIPRSRHNSQFNRETLPNSLRRRYRLRARPGLGGLTDPAPIRPTKPGAMLRFGVLPTTCRRANSRKAWSR